jgi:hypothetical protein
MSAKLTMLHQKTENKNTATNIFGQLMLKSCLR